LEDQPLSIRIHVDRVDLPAGQGTTGNGVFHVEHAPVAPAAGDRHRDLAVRLVRLPQVVSVEVLEVDPSEPSVGRLIVQARQPRAFFQELTQLVLEEWFEVRHLEPLDESTSAVLGYLLGGTPVVA
jgi:hypothetical protein